MLNGKFFVFRLKFKNFDSNKNFFMQCWTPSAISMSVSWRAYAPGVNINWYMSDKIGWFVGAVVIIHFICSLTIFHVLYSSSFSHIHSFYFCCHFLSSLSSYYFVPFAVLFTKSNKNNLCDILCMKRYMTTIRAVLFYFFFIFFKKKKTFGSFSVGLLSSRFDWWNGKAYMMINRKQNTNEIINKQTNDQPSNQHCNLFNSFFISKSKCNNDEEKSKYISIPWFHSICDFNWR